MWYYNRHITCNHVHHILLDMTIVRKQDSTLLTTFSGDQPKKDEGHRVCGICGGEHKYTQGSGKKT